MAATSRKIDHLNAGKWRSPGGKEGIRAPMSSCSPSRPNGTSFAMASASGRVFEEAGAWIVKLAIEIVRRPDIGLNFEGCRFLRKRVREGCRRPRAASLARRSRAPIAFHAPRSRSDIGFSHINTNGTCRHPRIRRIFYRSHPQQEHADRLLSCHWPRLG
jgi:hypothetical protein